MADPAVHVVGDRRNGRAGLDLGGRSGQRHYSDRPVPGAKQVELAGAQTFDAPARQPHQLRPIRRPRNDRRRLRKRLMRYSTS